MPCKIDVNWRFFGCRLCGMLTQKSNVRLDAKRHFYQEVAPPSETTCTTAWLLIVQCTYLVVVGLMLSDASYNVIAKNGLKTNILCTWVQLGWMIKWECKLLTTMPCNELFHTFINIFLACRHIWYIGWLIGLSRLDYF